VINLPALCLNLSSRWNAWRFPNCQRVPRGFGRSSWTDTELRLKSDGRLWLYSRNRKSFKTKFPLIYEGLADLPDNTVIDGEIVALDETGRPDFSLLQNYRSAAKQTSYFAFDLLVLEGRNLTSLPLIERRQLMRSLKFSSPLVRLCEQFDSSAEEMIAAVRQLGVEGVIGKRKDSKYETGKRTGSWIKHRINRGQEL